MASFDIEYDSVPHWTTIVMIAIVGLGILFGTLAAVRGWGLRMQKPHGASGGLDLEHLRCQRQAGEISQEEYDAVRSRLAGRPDKIKAPVPEKPIKDTDAGGCDQNGSETHEQA